LDSKLSEHILGLHKRGTVEAEPPISPDLLRKYISYSKNIKPTLTDEAIQRLKDFYLTMRAASEAEGSPIAITARQLESLVRIAEARARSALRDKVLAEDAEAAIAIMKKSLEQVGIDLSSRKIDIDIIMTGKPKSLRDKLQIVLGTVVELERENGMAKRSEVIEILKRDYSIPPAETERLLNQLLKEGTLYSPRNGYLKKT